MPYRNYPVTVYEDLKKLYHASAVHWGEKPFLLEKREGIYQPLSFASFCEATDALGTRLCSMGLQGKKILLIGENCSFWAITYMAVICGVGVVVPVDKNLPAEEIKQIALCADASAVISSKACLSKLRELPSLVQISFDDLEQLIKEGKKLMRAGDRSYLDAEIDPNEMRVLLFTSGTGGDAKGVMLSHRNLCFNLSEMCRMFYLDEKDTFLSVLPLHHAYEATCGFLCPLYRGATVAFCEGLRHMTRNMREVSPTILLCVPLLLETIYRKIWENIRKNGLEKQVEAMLQMTSSIPSDKIRPLSQKRLFADIHKSFGGGLRAIISGGAAADPEVIKGLRAFGFQAYQGYGLTECAPLVAINRDHFYNDASAGLATPNALLDICDAQNDGIGEIRYRGENVMLGYYGKPEATAEVIKDGWLYTGDLGYLDENGFLYVTGRKKNVIVTANGKNIFPEELEIALNKTPFVKESVVVGCKNAKKKDHDIIAVIYPDFARLEQSFGGHYTEAQLQLELKKAISGVNALVQSYKRISNFVIRREAFLKNSSQKIIRTGIAEEVASAYAAKTSK